MAIKHCVMHSAARDSLWLFFQSNSLEMFWVLDSFDYADRAADSAWCKGEGAVESEPDAGAGGTNIARLAAPGP